MDEKRIFNVGLKLVGVMNIISGLVNIISFIPVLMNIFGQNPMPNQIASILIQAFAQIMQVVAGIYLLKNSQIIVNYVYKK